MSYARVGEDSDVYVWGDLTHLWVIVSQTLEKVLPDKPAGLDRTPHHRRGATFQFTKRSECYAMLVALAAEGVNVPEYALTRLYDEMQTQGDEIGRKP